jgi:hypothetical protein
MDRLPLRRMVEMTSALIKIIFGITLILVAVIFGPILGIWSLNTLFPVLNIPYNVETWCAYFLLFGSITGLRFGLNRDK